MHAGTCTQHRTWHSEKSSKHKALAPAGGRTVLQCAPVRAASMLPGTPAASCSGPPPSGTAPPAAAGHPAGKVHRCMLVSLRRALLLGIHAELSCLMALCDCTQ
jgi:hypothetical protein